MNIEFFRQVDKLGRICIPKDLRKVLDIEANAEIVLIPTENGILITKKEKVQA